MKVILKADIKGVGKKDEVINASDGYVRNFLFPKNLAVEANAENMAKLQAQNSSKQFKKDTEKEEAQKLADDEPIERMIVTRTIQKYFPEELAVVSAVNGREAVEQFFCRELPDRPAGH